MPSLSQRAFRTDEMFSCPTLQFALSSLPPFPVHRKQKSRMIFVTRPLNIYQSSPFLFNPTSLPGLLQSPPPSLKLLPLLLDGGLFIKSPEFQFFQDAIFHHLPFQKLDGILNVAMSNFDIHCPSFENKKAPTRLGRR